jgi:Ion transport protein
MALRTSFAYMLGTYELAVLDAAPSQVMLSILWVVFSVIVSILLLNLLIAIISHNFEKLYENSEHSNMMEKTKVVLLSNIKLSSKRRAQLDKLLRDMPYIVVFKPYVYTEEAADKWATVDKMQAEVTELKQEVSTLKSIIQEILGAVKTIAPQTSSTGSVSIGIEHNDDEHDATATSLTSSTAAASTATTPATAAEEPTTTPTPTRVAATSTSPAVAQAD